MKQVLLLCLALTAAPLYGGDVRFPDLKPPPAPAPLPAPADPDAPVPLPASEWYVIEADAPLLLFPSPVGRLVVSHDEGPVRLKGRFVGGGGKSETRTFKGPHVYTVEAGHAGPVELIVVPSGAKTEAEAIRKQLVSGGEPAPPGPTPDPTPDPTPTPSENPFGQVNGLHVLMTYDSANTLRPATQNSVLYGKAVREYLSAKCAPSLGDGDGRAWRIYPDNTDVSTAPAAFAAAFAKRKDKDWLLIGNGKAGYSGPLPKTADEALGILKKLGGE